MTAAVSSRLSEVTRYVIPASVVEPTLSELRTVGEDHNEAFVVWGGTVSEGGKQLTFTSAVWPDQTASRSPEGLLVVVEGDALFALNKHLYQRGELLAGQVHTHPASAYHSSTDDDFPLVTLVGGLSVVIPDFARAGLQDLDRWAFYRLEALGVWRELDPAEHIVFT